MFDRRQLMIWLGKTIEKYPEIEIVFLTKNKQIVIVLSDNCYSKLSEPHEFLGHYKCSVLGLIEKEISETYPNIVFLRPDASFYQYEDGKQVEVECYGYESSETLYSVYTEYEEKRLKAVEVLKKVFWVFSMNKVGFETNTSGVEAAINRLKYDEILEVLKKLSGENSQLFSKVIKYLENYYEAS